MKKALLSKKPEAKTLQQWQTMIQKALDVINDGVYNDGTNSVKDRYVFYRQKSLFGLTIMLYVKESMVNRISNMYTGKICTGHGVGYTKNKGCSAL